MSPSTNLVNVSMNSLEGRDYVFSAVATAPPSAAGGMRIGDVAWRTLGDLHGVKAFAYASLAMRRELQLRQASGDAPLVIGALGDAVPLVPNAMGSAWSSAPDDAAAPAEWLLFLERDAQAAACLAAEMTRLDAGDGRLANWALNVKSTRDVAHEIPVPPQGRVRLDPSLRWLLLPEYFVPYPVPYTSQMLVRLPAQQVPPGFVPTHVSEAMEAWAIRRVHMHCLTERQRAVWFWENMPDQSVAALTQEQERAWLQGAPKGPGWLHLGAGAFKRIAHLDGIGYWVANAIVQQVDAQGRLTVFDWTVGFRSEFSTDDMMRMFDVKSDLELLSQLFDGTRYKAAPDRGLTLAPNLDSYASRAVQIAKELGSLAKMGRYVVRPLYYVEDAKDTGVWPTFFIPQTSISVGGVDQPYKPLKKRRVADASGAHVEVLARNRDDGAPDGEPYVSLNERYGPMRPAAGQQVCEVPHRLTPFGSLCDCCHVVLVRHSADGAHMWWGMLFCWRCLEGKLWRALEPLKWHKEGKHRVHHIYRACAYLGAAADIVQEDLTVLEDDWKTQFWQFRVHPIELPTSTMYAWVELYSSQIAWCHVAAYVNDMGKSPSSNITSSTSIHHVEVWKRNMVAIAAPVIATMGEEMNDMLDTRRERFGEMQALLWAAFAFTDDIILILVSAVLGALGAQEWDRISEVLKIQMSESDKRGCGTCPVHIGIRFVVNGGFGCAPPQKRVRALSGLRHAIDGTLHHATPMRAKAFESNCGLVGYLVDALAIDRALLRGIKRPLELAVFLDSEVTLTWDGLANHLELEFLISARGAASFDTAVRDALLLAGKSTATQRIAARRIRMGSDACTDAAHPAIYGMAECLAYVFPLTGAWLRLHVTVTESAGACLDFLVFPRRFPLALFCNETDASAAHAMVLGRSKSPTLKKMYSLLRKDPYFQAAAQRSTSQQVSGIANMTRDAGSRGHVEALRTYSAAMKMNIVVVELSEHELGFMAAILEATLEIGEALLVHPEPGTAMDVSDEAPLWQQLEPRAAGAASMAVVPGVEYGGEDQEVIKFMLH